MAKVILSYLALPAITRQVLKTILVAGVFCMGFFLPCIWLAVLIAYPALGFVKITRKNYIISLPTLFAFGIVITIINAVLLDTVNAPVALSFLALLSTAEYAVLALLKPKKYEMSAPPIDKAYIALIFIIFLLAIWSRVISISDLFAPLLHDPEAHAFWSLKIMRTESIDYFYSPGLHIWTVLLHQGLGLPRAREALTKHLNSMRQNDESVIQPPNNQNALGNSDIITWWQEKKLRLVVRTLGLVFIPSSLRDRLS